MPDWWIDPETDEEIQNVKKVGYNYLQYNLSDDIVL